MAFVVDRASRGLPVDRALGPDLPDQYAHTMLVAAGGIQAKSIGPVVGRAGALPSGLPPLQHAIHAEALTSPLASLPPLAEDLDFAIRTIVAEGTGIGKWRQKQWRRLRKLLKSTECLATSLDAQRGASSRRVAPHINLAALECYRYISLWPDARLATTMCSGAEIIGWIPEAGIYREATVEAALSEDELQESNESWIRSLLLSRPPSPDVAKVIFDKSEKERQLEILEGWYTKDEMDEKFGVGQWRPMMRFATWQENQQTYRVIDDAKKGGHNAATSATSRIHTTSAEVGFAVVRRFRNLHGKPLSGDLGLQIATKDMKRAFRQIPVAKEHLAFSTVLVYNIEQKAWRFGVLHGMAFGLSSAVLQFNRFPAAIVAVARRWLAIPAINFFDDFKLTEPRYAQGSGAKYFDKLVRSMGWLFDEEKVIEI